MKKLAPVLLIFVFLASANAWAQNQCGIATRNPRFSELMDHLRHSCESLQKLCNSYPEHGTCPEGYQPPRASVALDDAMTLEQDYLSRVFLASENLFPFRTKLSGGSLQSRISASDKQLYLEKMKVLDNLSRSKRPIVRRLMEHLALQATQDWLEIYGDPLIPDGLYNDPNGRTRQVEESVRAASLKQDLAVNATAFGTVAAYVSAHAASKHAKKLISGAPLLLAGLRSRFPIELAAELMAASAPIVAGTYVGTRNKINFDNFVPTPAHLIRFEMTEAFDMSEYDFRKVWGKKEFEIYQNALGDSTFWGAMMFVGYMGGKYGYRLSPGIMRALVTLEHAGKAGKVLKFFRITPAGLIIGFVAEAVVEEGIFEHRLHKYQKQLEAAARKKDAVTVFDKVNQIIHLYNDDMTMHLEMVQFYNDLKTFGTFALDPNEKAQVPGKLLNLSRHLHPINLPDMTGADLLQKVMCYAPQTTKTDWFNRFRNSQIRQDKTQRLGFQLLRKLSDATEKAADFIRWARGESARLKAAGLTQAAAIVDAKMRKISLMKGKFSSVLLDMQGRGGWFNSKPGIDDWVSALIQYEMKKPSQHFDSYYFCN